MHKTLLPLVATAALLVSCGAPPPAETPPAPAPPAPVAPPAVTERPTAAASAAPSASASAAAASPPAADDKFAKVTIKVEKVAGSVYMLEGEGGNIGVSVGDDGIVLVDDQFAPLAPKIKAAL